MICCYFTVQPSSLTIEHVTTEKRLLGTQEEDLVVSCTAIGGIPAPNVVLIIEGKSIPSQAQNKLHIVYLHLTR
jgi:hypothetical protein